MPKVSIIAAIQKADRGIGYRGALLFHIPEDMKRFKTMTIGHPVIMGRKTWESLPECFRPLPDRTNIIITRNTSYRAPGAVVVCSLEEALAQAQAHTNTEIFIIGGGEIYTQALPIANRLYLTLVESHEEADTFFPEYKDTFTKTVDKNTITADQQVVTFITLEK